MSNKRAESLIKRCRCSPSCYKWLRPDTRRKHYSNANPDGVLESDLGSDSDVEMEVEPNGAVEENSDTVSEDDADIVISDGQSTPSDELSEEEDWLVYNEEDEIAQETPKDIVEQLRDWCGPGIEEKLYRINPSLTLTENRTSHDYG
ncbi:hypothetical protein L210DRAFT_3508008 [Boletus edulis BED1]|uniref:Uncharacterized protein n=1 Tax=Boletus edulis BED1 TaxID=1328754 RepID=A0AAD4BI55_BOLED|nr:hypothetical protein L210DRAFT_3508008 [Boletus edulis BED1]